VFVLEGTRPPSLSYRTHAYRLREVLQTYLHQMQPMINKAQEILQHAASQV